MTVTLYLSHLQTYGQKILCIDSTHCTNAYQFKFITCLVQDEFCSGQYTVLWITQVVAWCIADQETAEVITILLNSLKQKPPDTQVTTLMTDDGKIGVMSHVPTIFYFSAL